MDVTPYLALIFGNPLVRWVLALLAANVIVGIAAALYTRTFRLAAIGDWLLSRALPYCLVSAALQLLVAFAIPEQRAMLEALSTTVWAFVGAALVGHILDTLRELGLPVPEALTDRTKPPASVSP